MPEQDVANATHQALEDLASGKTGQQIFDSIESNDALSHEEKMHVHCTAVKQAVAEEIEAGKSQGYATVMRDNGASSTMATAFMAKYAKEYNEAVFSEARNAAAQVNLPSQFQRTGYPINEAVGTNIPKAGDPTLTPESAAQWNRAYLKAGRAMADVVENQLPKLSNEALAFFQATGEAVDENIANAADATRVKAAIMTSTLALRGALAKVATSKTGGAKRSPEQERVDQFIVNSSAVALGYQNSVGKDVAPSEARAQNRIVNMFRDEKLDESRQRYNKILEGEVPDIQAAEIDLNNEVDEYEPLVGEEVPQVEQQVEQKVEQKVEQQAAVPEQGAQQQVQAGRPSVREMMAAAARKAKRTLGLDDQSKLEKVERQIEKRTNAIDRMKETKKAMVEELGEDASAKALAAKDDTSVYVLSGSTARDHQLQSLRDLDRHIDRSGLKLDNLIKKQNALSAKVEAKANSRHTHV